MPAFYKGYKCFAHKVTFAKGAKQPLQKGDARCKEAERCGDWKRETQTWQENLWEREKQQTSNSPSELVGPWQAFSSHLQVVSRTSNAGWLHPPRGLWCSKGREPWPLSWLCAQGPHGQVCQGCFCAWANAGPSPVSQPQILEKGKGRSSSDPSTHAILQFGNTAQLQWIFSNSTAGTILANPWKKRWSSFGRAPHEDQELEKNHHSTLCPWGWCSICQQQFFNGLVLGCLDDMLQLLAKQVLDLLRPKSATTEETWNDLLEEVCWSFSALLNGFHPSHDSDGAPLKKGSPFFANKGIAFFCKQRETIGKLIQRCDLGSDGWCWFFCIGPWPAPLGQQEALLWVRCFLQHCQSGKVFQKFGNWHPSLHKGDPCTCIGTSLHLKPLVQCHPRAVNQICERWCAAHMLCAWGLLTPPGECPPLHVLVQPWEAKKIPSGAVSSGVGSLAKGITKSWTAQPGWAISGSPCSQTPRTLTPHTLLWALRVVRQNTCFQHSWWFADHCCKLTSAKRGACWTAWNTCNKWTCIVMQTLCSRLQSGKKFLPLGKGFWTSIPCWIHGLKRKRDFSSTRCTSTISFSTWLKILDGWTPGAIGASPMKILWAKSACSLIASLLGWVPPGCQWR